MSYTGDWKPSPEIECRHCGEKECVEYRQWEDDEGHEDYHGRCTKCNETWWEEGSDA